MRTQSPIVAINTSTTISPRVENMLQKDEFLRLVINSIRNDLTSRNEAFHCLALGFVGSGSALPPSFALLWRIRFATNTSTEMCEPGKEGDLPFPFCRKFVDVFTVSFLRRKLQGF